MFNVLTKSKWAVLTVLITTLLAGQLAVARPAEAQSDMAAIQAQIAQLLQLISELQTQIAGMQGTDSSFSVGDRVRTTDTVRVRSGAGTKYSWVNNISAYTQGAVINGPRTADGYTWWHITYDNGTSGWSVNNWLNKMSQLATEPSPPIVTSVIVTNSENPTVSGYAYNTDTVGFSVSDGDKIYGSDDIEVVNNQWSHKIRKDLDDGTYKLTVYVDGDVFEKKSFVVDVVKPVEIEFIDTSAKIETSSPNLGEWPNFTIKFALTANDEDVWIRNSLSLSTDGRLVDSKHKPIVSIKKNNRVVTDFSDNFSSMQPGFLSNADYAYRVKSEKNDNYYVIEKGDTEKFTIDVTMTVDESAEYGIRLEGPLTVTTESGEDITVNFNEKDFVSPTIYVNGEDSVE